MEGTEGGALRLPPEGGQAGRQGPVAVKAPDAPGEEGGQHYACALVSDGGTPVEEISPVPLQKAQNGLLGDAALRHPAVGEFIAPALVPQIVDAAPQSLPDLRPAGAELGKGDAHEKALLFLVGFPN